MKTLIFTLLTAFSASAFAGGGIVGNGTDGLVATSNRRVVTYQDVTVPSPVVESAEAIIVNGEPGSGQSKEYCVTPISNDADGDRVTVDFARQSGRGLNTTMCANLGTPVFIDASLGSVRVSIEYNGSRIFTMKNPAERLSIHLSKIKIPADADLDDAKVYRDLTASDQRKGVLEFNRLRGVVHQSCRAILYQGVFQSLKPACERLMGGDFSAADKLILFNTDGPTSFSAAWNRGVANSLEINGYVGGKDGGFISVLPGTYVIQWNYRAATGSRYTRGIKVQ
jgi:hypothetical protein